VVGQEKTIAGKETDAWKPVGVVRQSPAPMSMHQANKAVEIMPDIQATARRCWREDDDPAEIAERLRETLEE
jgi:hypothetical protein